MDNQPTSDLRLSSANGNIALVILVLLVLACGCPNSNQTSKSVTNSTNVNANTNQAATGNTNEAVFANPNQATPSPALSSKENLEAGKTALTKGDLNTARSYLSAIPKGAPEYASATQLLRTVQAREGCAGIESQLAGVESDQAGVEQMLDATEDYSEEGTLKKGIYMNALKRKGQLQLQHIALKRKLKACGQKK